VKICGILRFLRDIKHGALGGHGGFAAAGVIL
jgi:hypothetical protein